MIVALASDAEAGAVRRALVRRGLWVERFSDSTDGGRVQFLVREGSSAVAAGELLAIAGVASVATADPSHPRVDAQPPVVEVAGVRIGVGLGVGLGVDPVFMAGPCSVESPEQILALASRLAPLGVRFLRGGAYKPRTSPYAFQGHGAPALGWLRQAADAHGLRVVTEALGVRQVEPVAEVADLIQIGSRNMHHTPLLRSVGRTGKPVLLKRGLAATLEEWLGAAEYCLVHGAAGVVLCERGIRGFDRSTRNLLDLGAVALLAHVHRLPVIVDPSHAVGRRDILAPLSRAALAAGAAGLMLETHEDPGRALSDGPQALSLAELRAIVAPHVADDFRQSPRPERPLARLRR
jgi:3-deoxy-7-phosphoheptulonate synthase